MKKGRDFTKPVAYLALASVLLGLSAAVGFNTLQASMSTAMGAIGLNPVLVAIGVAVMVFLAGIFVSWIFGIGMTVLGGKGRFFEGLVCVAYPLKLMSIGIVIASVASLLGTFSIIISFVALVFFGVLGYSALIRSTKEMFGVDMITAFIGVSVLFAVVMLAFYASAVFGAITSLSPTTLVP